MRNMKNARAWFPGSATMGVENAEKAAVWSQRMAAFEASGQPRRAWCRAQGLSINTFGYWRHRLRDGAAATTAVSSRPKRPRGAGKRTTMAAGLVPVVVRSAPASAPASIAMAIELEWPSGLRMKATLGTADLGALVR
jgi:hypothetical protein